MRQARSAGADLSRHQYIVFEAYARLGSQQAAAIELGIEVQTVKNLVGEVYRRLGVRGAVQAAYTLWHTPESDAEAIRRIALVRAARAVVDAVGQAPDRPRRVA